MADSMTTSVPVLTTTSAPGAPCRGEYWQQVVLSRVALARAELGNAPGPKEPIAAVRTRVEELLRDAEESARRPGSWIWVWLFGGAINQAFVSLHAAQVLLARFEPAERLDIRLESAMARGRTTIPPGPRLSHLENQFRIARADGNEDTKRLLLERTLEWSYSTTDAQYARLRSFRNVITIVSGVVILLLATLAIMGAVTPDSLNLLIHGRFVPGLEDLDTSGQILAYAVVFGVAQHAVTAFVDKRGHQILDDLPAKQSGRPATAVRRSGRSG